MVIFLNGAFGIGKSTVARGVQRQLRRAVIYDPEIVGFVVCLIGFHGKGETPAITKTCLCGGN